MEDTLTIIERTAFLKGTEMFASIPTETLAQLAGRGRELHFDAGATIFREGEPNSGAYMVVEGLIEIRKGRALDEYTSQMDIMAVLFRAFVRPNEVFAVYRELPAEPPEACGRPLPSPPVTTAGSR